MSYQFKMEKVLEFKTNVEKTKVEDYVKINIKLSKELDYLSEIETLYGDNKKKTGVDISEMKMQFLYKEKLKDQLHLQKKKVDEISTHLEHARGHLIEARKDRKIMEKLKDKDKEKFESDVFYQEQKELDDISVMKFAK